MKIKAEDGMVLVFRWLGPILQGDVTMFERWRWLRVRLRGGPARTLDAGSGSGAFAIYAAKRGNEVVGLSLDSRNNEAARRRAAMLGLGRARFVECDLSRLAELAPELGEFDQVICQETIEHIPDDARLVRDLAAVVKPGGRLYLTTPSADHRPYYGELASAEAGMPGGHVRFGYSSARLQEMLREAGFEVVETKGIVGAIAQWQFNFTSWLVDRLRAPGRVAWALAFPLRALQSLDPVFTRMVGYPFLSVAVVAERDPGGQS